MRDVAPQAGVTRRPSTPTIQSAVLRTQSLERGAVEAAVEAAPLMPAANRAHTAYGLHFDRGERRRWGQRSRAVRRSAGSRVARADAARGARATACNAGCDPR
ncbi:conserved hypothetical protein [Paraburkholderia piptadeniae]|uniref:Uncharacterized protein n=1 Tax=Paraburkholderia piptadeniae TaxID=1701573 RepID=A0A1N7RR09_9BURK|nr:conserved hypothetical protein [Paraburkholderia piptadeniae]